MAVRGRVDGMQGGAVTGWALAAPGRRHCSITVTGENGDLIAKGKASRPRPDLAAVGVGRMDLAFRLELPGCAARRVFHVFADGVELPGSPLEAGPGRYDGDCMIDGGVLKGWVRERVPEVTEPSISIVTQHGVIVGRGQSGRDAQAASPRAAFEIQLHNSCFGAGELRLAVLADGVKFTAASCNLLLHGGVDLLTPEACSGWLIAPDAPARRLEIEIFRDDVAAGVASCNLKRRDIGTLYPGGVSAGFAASFPLKDALELAASRISLRLRGSPVELFDGPFIVAPAEACVLVAQRAMRAVLGAPGMGPAEKSVIELAVRQFIGTARGGKGVAVAQPAGPAVRKPEMRLSIIIPVYGDVAATKTCIDSVLMHRIAAIDRVILVNDASPEPGMAALLEDYATQPNLFLLTNAGNLGFVKTVNRGFAFAGGGDVLLLNSDTVVFAGAFGELSAVAHAGADIGTVTALSNDATIFSYPGRDLPGEDLVDCSCAELAEIALAANAGVSVEVPTAHGFCMLIKAEVLRRAGVFDESFGRGYCEENDFCMRAADLGYRHVAAAGVLVRHEGSRSFGVEKAALLTSNAAQLGARYPEYLLSLRAFERRDGLRQARWALDGWRLERARRSGTQFVLVISNSLGGGSAKAMADIEQAVGYGKKVKLSLECRIDGGLRLSAAAPVFRAGFAEDEVEALFKLLDAAQPQQVLAHQLLGFSAAFIRRLQVWAKKRDSIYVAHDFYALCPRVTLIDAIGDFCDLTTTETCERCIAIGGAHADSRITGTTAAGHRALFSDLLHGFSKVIAPSASAAAFFRRGFPGLKVAVIPHPESGILPAGQAARLLEHTGPAIRRAEDAEEIVLFGALGPHKGSGKLLEIARRAKLTHPRLSFRVIGYTSLDEDLLALGNVTISGRYASDMLPILVAEARGNLALFLHEWPETYSYTLSEALSYGFVPLVADVGAPAARLREIQFGVVYPFPVDAMKVLRLIEDVLAGRVPMFVEGARPEAFHPGVVAVAAMRRVLRVGVARRLADGTPARPANEVAGALEIERGSCD